MPAQTGSKTGVVVILMLVSFIGYIVWQKVTLAKSLQVTFKKLDIKGNILFPEIYITVSIFNPTEFSAELQGLNGSIFVNNELKIASVNNFQSTSIAPYSTVDLLIKVDPVVSELITAIKNFLSVPSTPFSFIGTVRADGLSFPVNSTTTIQELING